MAYNINPFRGGAGPFGYSRDDLIKRPLEELDEMDLELEEVENNLQWGYEPGRWADGAEYYRNAWPEAKLIGADAFAESFDQRDDLTAEAADFRNLLGEAKKVWKTNAGLNSPFLPALAELPNTDRERVRNQSKKFRELIAFGETPDRWEWDVKNLRDSGDLLDPEADSQRLMGLYETKVDLIPRLDAMDHALGDH